MKMYLENAGTFRQMARLAGVNEANIARRIHKLVRRLLDGQYITCLRYRDIFTQEQIEIARDYFVDGLPISEIARRREISYYSVRRTLRKIQRLTTITRTDTDDNTD
jgi:transposase-like protein